MLHPFIPTPYQRDIKPRARAGNLAWAWDMGTGKTLGVLDAWQPGHENLYVAAPAAVTAQWGKEAAYLYGDMLLDPETDIDLIETTTQKPRGAPLTIFSYTAVSTSKILLPELMRLGKRPGQNTVLACDEAQKLKTPNSATTRAIYGWKDKDCLRMAVDAVWPMSGKFAHKDMGDLWTHTAALFPGMFGKHRAPTYDEFTAKFCEYAETTNIHTNGIKIIGGKNEAYLARMMLPYFSRITLEDAAPHLPSIMIDDYWLPMTPKVREQLRELHKDHKQVAQAITAAGSADEIYAIMDQNEVTQKSIRRLLGEIKAPLVAAKAAEDFAGGMDRLIIFGWHRSVLTEIANTLNNNGIYTDLIMGGLSTSQKDTIKRKFALAQTRCLCVNLLAGGVGVDGLQVANRALFVETSTVPGDNEQAIRRIRRLGQIRPQQVSFCTTPSPMDHAIMASAARRACSIARLEQGMTT